MGYTVALIGGDGRFRSLAAMLREDRCFSVLTAGLSETGREDTDLLTCLSEAELVVAPVPFSRDGRCLFAPYAASPIPFSRLEEAAAAAEEGRTDGGGRRVFLSGTLPDNLKAALVGHGFCCHDLLQRDDYAILNAIPTGEGVLQAVMEALPVTVFGLPSLVLGCGRVGRVLAKQLKALGAEVTVALRSGRDRAWAFSEGFSVCGYGEALEGVARGARLVVNTVPAPVLCESLIRQTRPDCLLVDVASGAGGTDFGAAEKYNRRALHLLALPGKAAPDSAAFYIKCVIENIIAESLKGC